MRDRLLSLADVMEETGLARATLYKHLAPHGDLPCIKVGRIRVKRSDLDAWIAKHRRAPKTERRETIRTSSEPAMGRYA